MRILLLFLFIQSSFALDSINHQEYINLISNKNDITSNQWFQALTYRILEKKREACLWNSPPRLNQNEICSMKNMWKNVDKILSEERILEKDQSYITMKELTKKQKLALSILHTRSKEERYFSYYKFKLEDIDSLRNLIKKERILELDEKGSLYSETNVSQYVNSVLLRLTTSL